MFWCFLTVHVFVIPVNFHATSSYLTQCAVSRVECLWTHDFLSKFIMTACVGCGKLDKTEML